MRERAQPASVRAQTAAMRMGEEVTYNGRRYAVVGFTPLSVTPFRVELLDDTTAESFWIEWPPEGDVPSSRSLTVRSSPARSSFNSPFTTAG
jgi:hypothetical protein